MFISALKSTGFAYSFFIFVNILLVKSAEVSNHFYIAVLALTKFFYHENFVSYRTQGNLDVKKI